MPLSPAGLCSFCDAFDVRVYARHQCGSPSYQCGDVVRGALDGCSFCCFVLDILAASDSVGGTVSQFWLRRVRKERRRLRAENPSTSIGDGLRSFWEQFICRGYWLDRWVRFSVSSGEDPGLDGMQISQMQLIVSFFGVHIGYSYLNVAADPGTPAWISGDIRGELIEPRSLEVERISGSIRDWHAACSANHPRCNQTLSRCETLNFDHIALPSRCIETERVHLPGSATQSELRFFLRETGGQSGKYLALSYRWGPETAPCQTTVKNYHARLTTGLAPPPDNTILPQARADVDTIPPLFVDTCVLALSLDIKYVWIDSLCIIQDDADDWEREGVNMARYYQSAWVTVAATVTNSAGGMFRHLEASEVPRISRLPYRNAKGEPDGFFYVQSMAPKVAGESFVTSVAESQLRERGWVLQESLLSSRVVSFSHIGIFVECRSEKPRPGAALADTDIFHDNYNSHYQAATAPPLRPSLVAYKGDVLGSGLRQLHESWYQLVLRYCVLDLTQIHKDRLMALAGIASEFGQAFAQAAREQAQTQTRRARDEEERGALDQDDFSLCYASGIWMNDIMDGLLWEQADPGPRSRAEALPTWSWSSMLTQKRNEAGEEILSGMRVVWWLKFRYYRFRVRVSPPLSSIEDAVVVTVTTDAQGRQHPRFDLPTTQLRPVTMAEDRVKGYGNANRFVALSLRGKLLQVDTITDMGDDSKKWASSTWRQGCRRHNVSFAETRLSGWASFEHPDYQTIPPGIIYALIIARERRLSSFAAYGDFFYVNFHVYLVLYIREVATTELFRPSYERVGVGEICGRELVGGFPNVEEERLWLV